MSGKYSARKFSGNGGSARPDWFSNMLDRPWVVEVAAFVLLVGSGVAVRLACRDLPNFAPVAALALFAGYFFRSSIVALCVPLTVMAVSDTVLGGYNWGMMALVYGMLALPVMFRRGLRKYLALEPGSMTEVAKPLAGLVTCGLMSSLLFFAVTNFGVWLEFGMYDHSLAGLAHCYAAAIPFFRYTLAGDMFFAVVLFGSYALAMNTVVRRQPATEASPLRDAA